MAGDQWIPAQAQIQAWLAAILEKEGFQELELMRRWSMVTGKFFSCALRMQGLIDLNLEAVAYDLRCHARF